MALTQLQKEIAVRLLLREKVEDIVKEFHLAMTELANWIKCEEFIEYQKKLAHDQDEKISTYLASKRLKHLTRLEDLSKQEKNLRVSRQATVDLLGYSGMENKNIAIPVINTTVNVDNKERDVKEIDEELDEVDNLLKEEGDSGSGKTS